MPLEWAPAHFSSGAIVLEEASDERAVGVAIAHGEQAVFLGFVAVLRGMPVRALGFVVSVALALNAVSYVPSGPHVHSRAFNDRFRRHALSVLGLVFSIFSAV
jgi:hypothetical protein